MPVIGDGAAVVDESRESLLQWKDRPVADGQEASHQDPANAAPRKRQPHPSPRSRHQDDQAQKPHHWHYVRGCEQPAYLGHDMKHAFTEAGTSRRPHLSDLQA